MIKKVGILTFWSFPEGMAPTVRIIAYSRGLVANGIEVQIFSFKRIYRDEVKADNIEKSGNIDGVRYRYIHYFNKFGRKFKLFRVIDEIILRVKLVFFVYRNHNYKNFDAFLFSFDDVRNLATYTKIFSYFNIPLVFVADEYPIPIRDEMKDNVPSTMLHQYKKYHQIFGARILMSESLRKFYDENIFPRPTFILNTIVDSSRFEKYIETPAPQVPYICYMGNMGLTKDNVDNIISAFSLINKFFPEIQLHLYGTPSKKDEQTLRNQIKELSLGDKVIIKGRASYSDVPTILSKATILVNSQPLTKRSKGGFPTKLGEYLLSKKPSVFTDSGDISTYVIDDKHCFIVPPESPKLYAEKLLFILNNYQHALDVAEAGESLIRNKFNAIQQTRSLISFLDDTLG